MGAWPARITHIRDQELVNAAVTSRPDRGLEQRTDHLRERIAALENAEALITYDQTVEEDAEIGHAVYWHAAAQRYDRALAAVEVDAVSGALVAAASADPLGVIKYKTNSTLADIVMLGSAAIDLTNSVDDPDEAGRLYLSGSEPGMLVRQRPPVSVPVLFNRGDGTVYVLPAMREFLEDHVHYRFALVCEPAGTCTPPTEGNRHTITDPDETLAGWLPADHEIFDGQAPVGAAFGYNLSAHQAVDRIWPPLPTDSASLIWDKGQYTTGGTFVPLGQAGLAVIDAAGIWWMSDCYGDVPWPVEFTEHISQSSSLSSTPECARVEAMSLLLTFASMVYATDKSVVTSLEVADGSPLLIVNCDGDAARTGALKISLSLDFLVDEDEDADGSLVFKELNSLTFKRGRVVSGLRPGDNVTMASEHSYEDDDGTVYQGDVTIAADTDVAERELAPQLFRLDAVQERFYQEITYLGFPAGRESGVRIRLYVPSLGLPATPRVKIRAVFLGRGTGTFPDLDASYRRVPRPDDDEEVELPETDTALTFETERAVTVDNYFEVESASFVVEAGDSLFIDITRAADDGYSAEVGLLRVTGILHNAEA